MYPTSATSKHIRANRHHVSAPLAPRRPSLYKPLCTPPPRPPHTRFQLEGRLKQLQDDYDTLSEQAHFSQSRAEELEAGLESAAEDLRRATSAGVARACVAQAALFRERAQLADVEEELADAERRAEGEEFFKLAQRKLTASAEGVCAERERTIELLEEELDAAKAYAGAVRVLLDAREVTEAGPAGVWGSSVDVESARAAAEAEAAVAAERGAREAAAADARVLRAMMEEHEAAADRIEELEKVVVELEHDENRLVDEVCALRQRIQDIEVWAGGGSGGGVTE